MINKDFTKLFHERVEPILDVYGDISNDEDAQHFGRIMICVFKYSIYGEFLDLDDKHDKAHLKSLRNAIDITNNGNRTYRINQTINSSLRYASDETDMRNRMQKWSDAEDINLTEEEMQVAIDKYNAKVGSQIAEDFKQDDVAEMLKKTNGVGKYAK